MNRNKIIVAYEYCTLTENTHASSDKIGIAPKAFKSLWNYALSSCESDIDNIMSAQIVKGHEVIRLKNYVGTIQTKDGTVIEILPKVYSSFSDGTSKELKEIHAQKARSLFLKMLKTVKDLDTKSFDVASIGTKKDFPILEGYISNYLEKVEFILIHGLKSSYEQIEANQSFLKGKILVSRNILKNQVDNSKFFVRYSKYVHDIPQNRILVSTLKYLSKISLNPQNKRKIRQLQSILCDIPESSNIISDIEKSKSGNRLFNEYKYVLDWSSQFLLKKGFTNFKGDHVNIALLFPAEKLFESYIAHLFKKYAGDYVTSAQHSKYYLIEKHVLPNSKNKKLFHLRPDMFLESINNDIPGEAKRIILDTKWKSLDENKSNQNYLIDIKDMYQLYAYGQKYKTGTPSVVPLLGLIYPKTEKHMGNIQPFFYEEGGVPLRLNVFAFDLLESEPKNEVRRIINILQSNNE